MSSIVHQRKSGTIWRIERRQPARSDVAIGGTRITFYKHSWEKYKANQPEKEEWDVTNHGIITLLALLKEMDRHGGHATPSFRCRPWDDEARLVEWTSDA